MSNDEIALVLSALCAEMLVPGSTGQYAPLAVSATLQFLCVGPPTDSGEGARVGLLETGVHEATHALCFFR